MPVIDEDKLQKKLKSQITDSVWIIFGDDSYLKDFYCTKLINTVIEPALSFFNLHTYNDCDVTLDKIFEDAEALPVMSDKTLLLIRNYPLNELSAEQLKSFEKNISDLPDTTVIVFFYSSIDVTYNQRQSAKWFNIINMISSCGIAAEINHRTRAKVAKMLVQRAPDRGTEISPEVAAYLIDCVGDDMQVLLNEFNKVCSFADGKPVTTEMIDCVAVKSVEASVFDISKSIFNGNADRAFEIANEMLRQKAPVQSVIGALGSAYSNIYRYKLALNSGNGTQEFAAAFSYRGSFSDFSQFTRKSTLSAIRKSISELLDADIRSKSTSVDAAVLLTELIAKLCAIAETANNT